MSDKLSFVPESVRNTVDSTAEVTKSEFKKGFKAFLVQLIGGGNEKKKQEEHAKKIQEKAEKSGKTVEEQAKLESLRKQLHQQMITPRPKAPEEPRTEDKDQVGTNEEMQQLGQPGVQSNNGLPPLAQPSARRGERLKIRE